MPSYQTQIEYFLGLYIQKYNPITKHYDPRRIRWVNNHLAKQWELWEQVGHPKSNKHRMLRRVTAIELDARGISLPTPPLPIKRQEPKHKYNRVKKLCPHENKIDMTRFGAAELEWICNDCGAKHTASMPKDITVPEDAIPISPPKNPKSIEAWLAKEEKRSKELDAWITEEEKRVADRRAKNAKGGRKDKRKGKMDKVEHAVEKVLFGAK